MNFICITKLFVLCGTNCTIAQNPRTHSQQIWIICIIMNCCWCEPRWLFCSNGGSNLMSIHFVWTENLFTFKLCIACWCYILKVNCSLAKYGRLAEESDHRWKPTDLHKLKWNSSVYWRGQHNLHNMHCAVISSRTIVVRKIVGTECNIKKWQIEYADVFEPKICVRFAFPQSFVNALSSFKTEIDLAMYLWLALFAYAKFGHWKESTD